MLNEVLSKPLREKAGSDAYNRFEYQTGWVVFHVLDKLNKDERDFLIFCEFHDDVAEAQNPNAPDCLHFFQVKTKAKEEDWTLSSLTEYGKNKRNGKIKHSFLGYIFYNFYEFGQECGKCAFVSNRPFSQELRKWQQVVQDGKSLRDCEPLLYKKLRDRMREEFPDKPEPRFNQVFDVFCQNTWLNVCELPLVGYEKYIKGAFFDVVARKYDIKASTAKMVIDDIWEEVRKKAKTQVATPVSLQSLIAQKGITGAILHDLHSSLARKSADTIKDLIRSRYSHKPALGRVILREVREFQTRKLNVNDTPYQDLIADYTSFCDHLISSHLSRLDDTDFIDQVLDTEIHRFIQGYCTPVPVSALHLRGVFYARLFAGDED